MENDEIAGVRDMRNSCKRASAEHVCGYHTYELSLVSSILSIIIKKMSEVPKSQGDGDDEHDGGGADVSA